VDTYELHNALNPRTLGAIYEKYMGKPMEDAHDADVDVTATKDVFLKLIDKHSLEGISFHDIRQFANNNKPVVDIEGKFTVNEDGDFAFNFGKHGGKNVLDNRDYLSWMLNGNFSSDVKGWCQKFINM
jgi:DNA polymerase-3 subunit epsilon